MKILMARIKDLKKFQDSKFYLSIDNLKEYIMNIIQDNFL